MYAVVEVSGKQYRVEEGDSLVVDRISEGEGKKIDLTPVLYRPDKGDAVFDSAGLGKVKVEAVVKGHRRGPKVRVFKYKPKQGYRNRSGYRSEQTELEIKGIKSGTAKTPAKSETKPKADSKAKPATKAAPKAKTTAKPKAATKPKGETRPKADTKPSPAKKAAPKASAAKKSADSTKKDS